MQHNQSSTINGVYKNSIQWEMELLEKSNSRNKSKLNNWRPDQKTKLKKMGPVLVFS